MTRVNIVEVRTYNAVQTRSGDLPVPLFTLITLWCQTNAAMACPRAVTRETPIARGLSVCATEYWPSPSRWPVAACQAKSILGSIGCVRSSDRRDQRRAPWFPSISSPMPMQIILSFDCEDRVRTSSIACYPKWSDRQASPPNLSPRASSRLNETCSPKLVPITKVYFKDVYEAKTASSRGMTVCAPESYWAPANGLLSSSYSRCLRWTPGTRSPAAVDKRTQIGMVSI